MRGTTAKWLLRGTLLSSRKKCATNSQTTTGSNEHRVEVRLALEVCSGLDKYASSYQHGAGEKISLRFKGKLKTVEADELTAVYCALCNRIHWLTSNSDPDSYYCLSYPLDPEHDLLTPESQAELCAMLKRVRRGVLPFDE